MQKIFEKPEECPVCYDKLDENDNPLECGHWVHKECVKKSGVSRCPLGRCKLNIQVYKLPKEQIISSEIEELFDEDSDIDSLEGDSYNDEESLYLSRDSLDSIEEIQLKDTIKQLKKFKNKTDNEIWLSEDINFLNNILKYREWDVMNVDQVCRDAILRYTSSGSSKNYYIQTEEHFYHNNYFTEEESYLF